MVAPSEPIEVATASRRFVSRGGEKLDAALDHFEIDVRGLRCLDVGSSTGGFTDCLLQRGASHVVALDVGRGQLDWSLRNDDRVTSLERTDVRDVDPAQIGDLDLVVVDVSFISVRTVLESLARIAQGAPMLVLVKPQFEVREGRRAPGGVVRDDAVRERAVDAVVRKAEDLGLRCEASFASPVLGMEGNQELFVLLRRNT